MSEKLIDRYKEVRAKIDETCVKCGRDPKEVTLIAVSKTKPLEDIEELIKYEVNDLYQSSSV